MFFTVPPRPKATTLSPRKPSKLAKRAATDNIESTYYRRRVPTACDRCRLKKARCSGDAPCKKCETDGILCVISKDRSETTKLVTSVQLMTDEPAGVDWKPKGPGYVRMVESQRDLLLRAVHELQRKSNTHPNDPADMNEVLRELNIQVGDSGNTSHTVLQDLTLPQSTTNDTGICQESRAFPGFDPTDLEKSSFFSTTSMQTPSPPATVNAEFFSSGATAGNSVETGGLPETDYLQGVLNTYPLDDEMLSAQWASNTNDPYIGYGCNMDLAAANQMDIDGLQQQPGHDGMMEYFDTTVMQGAS